MAGYGRIEDGDLLDGLSTWYLKASGLWGIINHYRDTGSKSAVFQAWMFIAVVGFGPLFFTSIVGPFFVEKDLEGMTLVILNPMSALQMAVKFSVIWYGMETQAQLLNLMKKDYMKCVPQDKKSRANEILQNAVKDANLLAYMSVIANSVTVSVWNILPVLRSEYVRLTLGITIFGTPPVGHNKILGFWYPINHTETPWTQIVYVYEFFICFWAGMIITLLEALVAQLIVLLTAHIKVFQLLMKEMKHSSELNTNKLLVYIKEHQRFMKVGDDLRNLYNILITMTLATGQVILIIAIFNFSLGTGKGDVVIMFKFVIYTMYTLVEVCIYCYAGSDLEAMNEDVAFAAYSSDWYTMGVDFRKLLLMMMIRCRSPISLKAGKLYTVNLMTLTNILQMAYSTSMLLYRATKEDLV